MIDPENIVWVKWIDSSGCSGWKSEADLKARRVSTIVSVGFVLQETDTVIALVQNVDKDEPGPGQKGEDYACDLITIPRVAIIDGPRKLIREDQWAVKRVGVEPMITHEPLAH